VREATPAEGRSAFRRRRTPSRWAHRGRPRHVRRRLRATVDGHRPVGDPRGRQTNRSRSSGTCESRTGRAHRRPALGHSPVPRAAGPLRRSARVQAGPPSWPSIWHLAPKHGKPDHPLGRTGGGSGLGRSLGVRVAGRSVVGHTQSVPKGLTPRCVRCPSCRLGRSCRRGWRRSLTGRSGDLDVRAAVPAADELARALIGTAKIRWQSSLGHLMRTTSSRPEPCGALFADEPEVLTGSNAVSAQIALGLNQIHARPCEFFPSPYNRLRARTRPPRSRNVGFAIPRIDDPLSTRYRPALPLGHTL
jgi:hypothetical protein